jgi:hypothetical protein
MLARRLFAAPAFAAVVSRRFKADVEDDSWLEATMDANQKAKTPEEKYAAEAQARILKAMMKKMKEHTTEEVAKSHTSKQSEIDALKAQVDTLHAKIGDLSK